MRKLMKKNVLPIVRDNRSVLTVQV